MVLKPAWTLITVTYNSSAALRESWQGFEKPDNVEWVVVDNNSSDDSIAVSRELGASVIALTKNVGFGAANNIGFDSTTSDNVAFVNPDVEVESSDLPRIACFLDHNPRALVSPQLVNSDGTLQPNGRGLPFLTHKVTNRLCPQTLDGSYLKTAVEPKPLEVEWLMGAMVATKRGHFRSIGKWDERFFVYYEDSDLGLRNLRSGGSNFVLGDTRWVHGWARETSAPSVAAWRRELPSMMKFYSRYPSLLKPKFSMRRS